MPAGLRGRLCCISGVECGFSCWLLRGRDVVDGWRPERPGLARPAGAADACGAVSVWCCELDVGALGGA